MPDLKLFMRKMKMKSKAGKGKNKGNKTLVILLAILIFLLIFIILFKLGVINIDLGEKKIDLSSVFTSEESEEIEKDTESKVYQPQYASIERPDKSWLYPYKVYSEEVVNIFMDEGYEEAIKVISHQVDITESGDTLIYKLGKTELIRTDDTHFVDNNGTLYTVTAVDANGEIPYILVATKEELEKFKNDITVAKERNN